MPHFNPGPVEPPAIACINLNREKVARKMAVGERHCSNTSLVISITGLADGTDSCIEAGMQCFPWCFADSDDPSEQQFSETKNASTTVMPSVTRPRCMRWRRFMKCLYGAGNRPTPHTQKVKVQHECH
jgi:nicotinamide mononucleotide (NMN) deamidase PncC